MAGRWLASGTTWLWVWGREALQPYFSSAIWPLYLRGHLFPLWCQCCHQPGERAPLSEKYPPSLPLLPSVGLVLHRDIATVSDMPWCWGRAVGGLVHKGERCHAVAVLPLSQCSCRTRAGSSAAVYQLPLWALVQLGEHTVLVWMRQWEEEMEKEGTERTESVGVQG